MPRNVERFFFPYAPHLHVGRGTAIVGTLAVVTVFAVILTVGGSLLVLLPFLLVPVISAVVYHAVAQVQYVEVLPGKLRIGYRARRRDIPFSRIEGWRRLPRPDALSSTAPIYSLHAMADHLRKEFGELEIIATTVTEFMVIRLAGGRKSLLVGVKRMDEFEQALDRAVRR